MSNSQKTRANRNDALPVAMGSLRLRMRSMAARLSLLLVFGFGASALEAQSTYQIATATYGTSSYVPAGANGAVLSLTGTLPSAAQQAASTVLGCFYTGSGSTAGFPLSAPTNATSEPLTVPASTIQSIPLTQFTAANNYTVQGLVYFITADNVCDGTFDKTFTNQYPVQVVAPSLGTYTGPGSVPQTNPSTNLQAAPLALVLPAGGFFQSGGTLGLTTVIFGSFGSVTPVIPPTATSTIYVPVPAAFSSSVVGTTASLSICNTLNGVTAPVCITPTPAITLTVTALANSAGTITATPNPVLTSGTTVLTAQFKKGANAGTAVNLGAPAGPVSFVADGNTLAPAPLILDTTATFTSQTTTVSAPAAPTPVITPAAGNYTGAQTVTITDSAASAAIYYTQDGTTPSNGSTLYTAPFSISTSQTVTAIAAVAGYSNSAVASAAYVVTVRPATHLAFVVQPSNTALNTAISPGVQVALEDSTNAVVTTATDAVNISLYSDPGDISLGGTTTQNAVNGIATFPDLTLASLGTGYSLQADSGNLIPATSQPFNVTPPAITMTVQSELVGINSTLNGSFTLGAPAPAGGLVVTLTSGTPANVTITPAMVTVAAGVKTGTFTYSGVAAGNSTLSASATSYTTGTVQTTATAAQVSLGTIPNVAPAQMQSIALSLATAAPAGGTTVTFTIANPNIATVTATSFVPAGQFTPAANPQVTGVLIGTTTVTATAPGYAPATLPVVVTVTAAFNPGTTNINLVTSTNTSLTISAPAPPGGIVFTLSSSSPAIATVQPSVTVVAGATSVPISIAGVSAGSVTLTASSAGVTPATGTVNVDSNIGTSTFLTGYDLQEITNLYLPVSPSVPTTVTVTVADPTIAVITTNGTVAGQATLTFPNITQDYIGTIGVQGLKVGTTNITISAPGYTAGTIAVTVNPSGFVISGYYATFSTTTYSSPNGLPVYPAILNADLSYNVTSTLNPQSAATITLTDTSSAPAIGTATSPLVFSPNNTEQDISFQPVAAGTTTVTLGTPPAGFSVSTSYQQAVATVTTPVISIGSQTTAVHLMNSLGIGLPENPPANQPVTVTITSSDPTIATISTSPTVVGTASVTFPMTTSTSVGTIYLQGQKTGSVTLTQSAPGYVTGTNTVTVIPGGFFMYYPGTSFSTTTFSTPTGLNVYTSGLDPNTLAPDYNYLEVSPGVAPFNVGFTNSTPATGTISANSVTFSPGDNQHDVLFTPVAAGTSTVTLVTPAGFTTSSQFQSVVATVTAPAIGVNNQETGVNLQNQLGIYLPVSPPSGQTVTVTSSNPQVAKISTSATAVGSASVTFTNVTSTYAGTIYIQGQSIGTSTITVSSAGYTSGTSTVTVDPSGFTYYYNRPPFTTTTFSSYNSIPVYTTSIENGNVYNLGLGLNPGAAPVTVAVTDSAPSVGTISAAALVFNPGDGSQSFNFQPVSAGDTVIAISTPTGYTTAPYVSGDITVTAPAISIGNLTTAVKLQQSMNIYLPQTPPNPVTVTVTSSSPTLATLSTDPTVVGTKTIVFTNVTSTSVGTIYVQGQALGTAQLTETAPGYTDGSSTVTVQPAGFAFYNTNETFTTTVADGPYALTAYPFALNTGTNTLIYYPLMVNPGLGNITVPVTSSDTSVGTTPTGPSFAPGASSANFNFVPVGTGTSTITLGTPAGFTLPSQNQTATGTVQ